MRLLRNRLVAFLISAVTVVFSASFMFAFDEVPEADVIVEETEEELAEETLEEDDSENEEELEYPWARTPAVRALGTTGHHQMRQRNRIGEPLYAEFGNDLYSVEVRLRSDTQITVTIEFRSSLSLERFHEAVAASIDATLEVVNPRRHTIASDPSGSFTFRVHLLDEDLTRHWGFSVFNNTTSRGSNLDLTGLGTLQEYPRDSSGQRYRTSPGRDVSERLFRIVPRDIHETIRQNPSLFP